MPTKITVKEYEHFKRIRKMLADSGEYDGWVEYEEDILTRDGVLNTDTNLILQMPHLNPEFF